MIDWILLGAMLFFCAYSVYGFNTKKVNPIVNRINFYLKDIWISIVILGVIFLIHKAAFSPLPFENLDKGMFSNKDILSIVIAIITAPFVMAFTPFSQNYPEDIQNAKELFGMPIEIAPNTLKEVFVFIIFIIIGVVFEEYFFRQILFHVLNETMALEGDLLIIIGALIFSIVHFYQGWKGMLLSFVGGLLLGKIFLISESILLPIGLHLILNLTAVVLSVRRIKDLKKIDN